MWGMIISIISGILMSVQGVFNTKVTEATNIWITSAFVQFTAFVVCMAAWFFTGRGSSITQVINFRPLYMLSGGIIGAFITYTVVVGMDMLSPAKAVMFIVTAQVAAAYLIELFGMFGVSKVSFQWSKLIGVILMIAGIIVFKWEKALN